MSMLSSLWSTAGSALSQLAHKLNRAPDFKSSPAFFETKYRKQADPWNFAKSAYELQRYDRIIEAIAYRRYHRAFEPGCSIGVLTQRLAGICDTVDAFDFSPSASEQAQKRCAHLGNVHVTCASIPERLPAPGSDLLVLSEIGYYFNAARWQEIVAELIARIPSGSIVLASHWQGYSKDHCIPGAEVHQVMVANRQLRLDYSESDESLRLDRFLRL